MKRKKIVWGASVLAAAFCAVGVSQMQASVQASADVPSIWETSYAVSLSVTHPGSKHLQGVTADDSGNTYFSFTDTLYKVNANGDVVASVTGINGHLGDIAYHNGRVYGTLMTNNYQDYENSDSYIAIFDLNSMTTTGMSSTDGSVMSTVCLENVLSPYVEGEYAYTGDSWLGGKFGLYAGVDPITFGPKFGEADGDTYLTIIPPTLNSNKIYKNEDARHILFMQFNLASLESYASNTEVATHGRGPSAPDELHYFYAGIFGQVQTLTYDEYTQSYMVATYSESTNNTTDTRYSAYLVDATVAPVAGTLKGIDYDGDGVEDAGTLLTCKKQGIKDDVVGIYGYTFGASVGIHAFGDGYYYLAGNTDETSSQLGKVTLRYWDESRKNYGSPFNSTAIRNPFVLADGASIRTNPPAGIRFTASIPTADVPDGASFGMLLMPTDLLNGEALTVDVDNVLDIPANVTFADGAGNTCYNAVLVGTAGNDFPTEFYGKSITARGYARYTIGGNEFLRYTANSVERSMAEVAASSIKETGESTDFLTAIVDSVVGGRISVAEDSLALSVGGTVALTVSGNEGLPYILKATGDCIAVDGENITAIGEGEGSVTVQLGSFTKTVPVTVTGAVGKATIYAFDSTSATTGVTSNWGGTPTYTTAKAHGTESGSLHVTLTATDVKFTLGTAAAAVKNLSAFKYVEFYVFVEDAQKASVPSEFKVAGNTLSPTLKTNEWVLVQIPIATESYTITGEEYMMIGSGGGSWNKGTAGSKAYISAVKAVVDGTFVYDANDATTWGWTLGYGVSTSESKKGELWAHSWYGITEYLSLSQITQLVSEVGGYAFFGGFALYSDNTETSSTNKNCLYAKMVSHATGNSGEALSLNAEELRELLATYPTAKYIRLVVKKTLSGTLSQGQINGVTWNLTNAPSIKILAIGNSFSVDAMEYLGDMLLDVGYGTVVLGNFYVGGGSLQTHWGNIENGSKITYHSYENGAWTKNIYNQKILDRLVSQDWDVITVQQASGESGDTSTYSPYLENIVNYIHDNKTNENAKVYWHMTWAYQGDSTHESFPAYDSNQMTMYNAIVNATQTVVNVTEGIEGVIPCGTAVQNLRTSALGDTLTRDGYHMSKGVGRYLTALTWFARLTGLSVELVDYIPESYRTEIEPHLAAIKASVTSAIETPYAVTEIE